MKQSEGSLKPGIISCVGHRWLRSSWGWKVQDIRDSVVFLWVIVVMEYLGILWHSSSVTALNNICVFTRINNIRVIWTVNLIKPSGVLWPPCCPTIFSYEEFFFFFLNIISPFCSTRIVKRSKLVTNSSRDRLNMIYQIRMHWNLSKLRREH